MALARAAEIERAFDVLQSVLPVEALTPKIRTAYEKNVLFWFDEQSGEQKSPPVPPVKQ